MIQTGKYSTSLPQTAPTHSQIQTIDPRLQRFPIEPNKMFYKTNKIVSKPPVKSSSSSLSLMSSFVNDLPSRLNQFSWEEIEGRYVPVIFR